MGYLSMVRGNARKAFSLVKDLADDVTLTSKNNVTYDFGTKDATAATQTTKVVKGILKEQKRYFSSSDSEIHATVGKEFLFLAEDISDPTLYDTITMSNSSVWRMIPPYKNDGILITVTVTREVPIG